VGVGSGNGGPTTFMLLSWDSYEKKELGEA